MTVLISPHVYDINTGTCDFLLSGIVFFFFFQFCCNTILNVGLLGICFKPSLQNGKISIHLQTCSLHHPSYPNTATHPSSSSSTLPPPLFSPLLLPQRCRLNLLPLFPVTWVGNRIPAFYYLFPSVWCQCSSSCETCLEVQGLFNGDSCADPDSQRVQQPAGLHAHLSPRLPFASPESRSTHSLIAPWIPGQSPPHFSSPG